MSHSLQYAVEWRTIRAGNARVTWTRVPAGGYQADLHLESAGLVSKLYRVNDDYRAELGPKLCAENVVMKSEEGKRRRLTKITFDESKVSYLERDLVKDNVVLAKELPVPPCVHEYLGALHALRSMDLQPGQSTTVPVSDGKKFANVKVDAQEREVVETPAGKFRAMRYEVHMFNGVIMSRKARMYVWVTDDPRRLPVQLRFRLPILIGTITLQLEKEQPVQERPNA